jgi:hypothetical protein
MRTCLFALSFVAAAACTTGDTDSAAGAGDTAAAAAAPGGGLRVVATVQGLSAPESAIFDSAQDLWFVTNINGSPGARDNNGFISRISADGVVDSLRFIEGGRGGVTLHAPKGTAIVGDTLWVADLDALRAFHTRTGAALTTIEFGARAGFLNDVAIGPDGAMYVTDTGIRFGADGSVTPAGTDQVFRVGPDRSVTTALKADSLMAPNGIAWDAAANRFLVVSFQSPTLFHWTVGDTAPTAYGSAGGGNDGAEFVGGMLLLTSWEDSALVAVENGTERALVGGLSGPADIGIDAARNRVAVPLLSADRVEIYELPAR